MLVCIGALAVLSSPAYQVIACYPTQLRLDAVITVVDAAHCLAHLTQADGDSNTHCEQVVFADRILVNKSDLVCADLLHQVTAAVALLNPTAQIFECVRSNVPLKALLSQCAFEPSVALERHPKLKLTPPRDDAAYAGSEADDVEPSFGAASFAPRRQGVTEHGGLETMTISAAELDLDAFNAWIAALVKDQGERLLRLKGILAIAGQNRKFVFHSVHMIVEGGAGSEWAPHEVRASRLVVIGRKLRRLDLGRGMRACEKAVCSDFVGRSSGQSGWGLTTLEKGWVAAVCAP